MEKIYEDFTTKMLPELSTGLTITKDYFADLFGRYVKYLIIQDSIWLIIGFGIFCGGVITLHWACGIEQEDRWNRSEAAGSIAVLGMVFLLLSVIGVIVMLISAFDLAQDLTIPEIRVYEELSNMVR